MVLLLEQGENVLARPRVGNEPGVLADQPEIDVGEGLLHLVDDQTEQAEVGEHPLEERLAPGAADLQKRRDPAPDPVPARHEVTVLRPREYPRDGPQVGERARPEPPRRARADVEQPDLLERARLLKIRDQVGVLDEAAIGRVGRARQSFHRLVELGRRDKRPLPP